MVATRKRQRKPHHGHPRQAAEDYSAFERIDGRHPFKEAVPGGYIDYQVRTRRGGRVAYFNFDLAIEMGLIPKDHPRRLTRALRQALLSTFALQIINEYDMINGTAIPRQDIRPHRYMATRYLQLQHADKRGLTSGDGRSIWNGSVTCHGVTWDVSSCGTGATSLSPATAEHKRFFRTGDPRVCYGCGHADLHTGLAGAILSEILYRSGVPTERTLAVIGFPHGRSINVRAGRNLLRPSHFFLHLRQGNYASLKAAVDFFIDRQAANGVARASPPRRRYEDFAEAMAVTFARSAAIFEAQYLFVWMDWDGDNILADGGIVDYGSVRQFGLYHQEYRYDDTDRMSTSLPEQRLKAREMVQTFAQLRDYLLTGKERPRSDFHKDHILEIFDRTFADTTLELLLTGMGFDRDQAEFLLRYHRPAVERMHGAHVYFERAKSARGLYKVPDGVTWDAIYSMRNVMREVPRHMMTHGAAPAPAEFMAIMASSFASRNDRKLTPARVRRIEGYLELYQGLLAAVGHHAGLSPRRVLLGLSMRAGLANREDRITGNAVLWIAEILAKQGKDIPGDQLQALIEAMIAQQVPEGDGTRAVEMVKRGGARVRSLAKRCLKYVREFKDGL